MECDLPWYISCQRELLREELILDLALFESDLFVLFCMSITEVFVNHRSVN